MSLLALFLFSLLHTTLFASSYFPIKVELKEPSYKQGTLSTTEGGVIRGSGLYIQGKHLTYTKKETEGKTLHLVEANQDLMIEIEGQIFLADYVFYDLEAQSGYILRGKTTFQPWYIEAEKITLNKDKSFDVYQAILSTAKENSPVWNMQAEHIHFTKDKSLTAKNLSLKIHRTPIFWFPWIKTHLGPSIETPYKYSLVWDAGQGPIISFRYKIFSIDNFNVYARAEYRYKRGPGGALEMDYKSDDKLTFFQSKNYLCNETFYNDDNPNKRIKKFRLQGIFKKSSADGRADLDLIYDRFNDKNLPQDFKMDEFELNTQRQNRLIGRYLHDAYQVGFKVRPRINGFDGYNQELPSIFMHVKPLSLSPTPFVLFNTFQLSYYDYVYSNILKYPPIYKTALQDFHAVRAETKQQLILPLKVKGLNLNPYVGFIGIAYNKNPFGQSSLQAIMDYGLKGDVRLYKTFSQYKHSVRPYMDYKGLYKPVHPPDDVYIFSINDGYHSLNLIRFGLDQHLFDKKYSTHTPRFNLDTYGLLFVHDFTYKNLIPKAGLYLSFCAENTLLSADIRWNFNNHVLDFSNILLSYTLNANLAFECEYRYRSAYDWRKNNHNDFILDVTRPIDELLNSPLSDQRQTFITKAELKLTPTLTCQLQTHHGWGRKNEPSYNEAKLNLITFINSAWKLKLYYMYTTRGGSHAGMKIELIQ